MKQQYFDTSPFTKLIQERSGITLDESRAEELREKIRQRMSRCGIERPTDYYQHLTNNNLEFDDLINLLTVNETYFFREPGHIDLLTNRLIPERLQSLAPGETIKILSAGCSTGEEPYSLAMAIKEKFPPNQLHSFSIIGIDIDKEAINTALKGIYSAYSFRSMKISFPNPFFNDLNEKKYQLKQSIKNMVTFKTVNLVSQPYPALLSDTDFIFYRNVSIYFPPEVQRQVFQNLANILKENGYLIVSATETLSHGYGLLHLIERDGFFIFAKQSVNICERPKLTLLENHPTLTVSFKPVEPPKPFKVDSSTTDKTDFKPDNKPPVLCEPASHNIQAQASALSEDAYQQAFNMARSKQYAASLALLNQRLLAQPYDKTSTILKAEVLFNLNRFDEAEDICRSIMEQDPLCIESHLLAGIIAKQEQRLTDAIKSFKAVIYINSASWLAHFLVAEIQQSFFDSERAIRGYQTVLKCLESGNTNVPGLILFSSSFSINDIIRLCQTRIIQINQSRDKHGV